MAKYVKVSQKTIDRIKTLGMTAALKKAGSSNNAEYIEGIRRMYGERRLNAARGTKSSKKMTPREAERTVANRMSPRIAERSTAKAKTGLSGLKGPTMPGAGPAVKAGTAAKKKTAASPSFRNYARGPITIGKATKKKTAKATSSKAKSGYMLPAWQGRLK
jgi:hypothetical protein